MYVQNQETRCEVGKRINQDISVTESGNDPKKYMAAEARH